MLGPLPKPAQTVKCPFLLHLLQKVCDMSDWNQTTTSEPTPRQGFLKLWPSHVGGYTINAAHGEHQDIIHLMFSRDFAIEILKNNNKRNVKIREHCALRFRYHINDRGYSQILYKNYSMFWSVYFQIYGKETHPKLQKQRLPRYVSWSKHDRL